MIEQLNDDAAKRMYHELLLQHLSKKKHRRLTPKQARRIVCQKFNVSEATFFRRGFNQYARNSD